MQMVQLEVYVMVCALHICTVLPALEGQCQDPASNGVLYTVRTEF